MSTTFQSCPKCQCFILSDTYECPECGHVFDEKRAEASRAAVEKESLKSLDMYDSCRECGESVRTGLVRCWNCNAFMRSDVEAKYREMTSQPQQIIFSDIPKEKRTEFIPARGEDGRTRARVFDADDDDTSFSLQSSQSAAPTPRATQATPAPASSSDDDGFELDGVPAKPAAAASATTSKSAPKEESKPEAKPEPVEAKDDSGDGAATPASADNKGGDSADVDDLLGIALQDQKETQRRKREKLQEAKRQRILLPCACGAWIRVHQDQAGKVVRCRQCKAPIMVPQIKKKEKEAGKQGDTAPEISVTWLEDVRRHLITPTDVALKPGSLEKTFEAVDVGIHESGVYLIKFAAPAKKSLFSKSTDGPPAVEEQRKQVRERISKSGKFEDLPFVELQKIGSDQIDSIRLIQPVAEAHASMFAGVPVFGDGQIAVYLPMQLADNQQAFLSFPLTAARAFSEELQNLFKLDLETEKNGIPAKEEFDTLKCHFSELPVKSLKNVVYYQADPGYEVEVAGHICSTCGIAITEDARAKKKLGGAAGKGIAKAKCPACSNKFGDKKAYILTKTPADDAPEEEEDVSEVLKPKSPKAEAAAAGSSNATQPSLESLQGKWKMVSLARSGNFENPDDVRPAQIELAISEDQYTVTATGEVQEKGTLKVDAKQNPAHLDQTITEGADVGKSHLGIFRLVDGRLENCQGDFDKERPTSFESKEGSAASLAIFERV